MEITARGKLKRTLETEAACLKQYGRDMMKKIMMRLNALRAAVSLADFWPPNSGPERCHELKGDLAGTFSIDLKQPYRLLFVPIEENALEDRSDEQKRWASITKIEIVAIEDTHG
jgi:plasmid maintenance system killer protein